MKVVVEKFYSTAEVGMLLGFGLKWVRKHLGEFQAHGTVVNVDGDWRLSASAINGYLESRTVALPKQGEPGVYARSATELKRKLRAAAKEQEQQDGEPVTVLD